MKVLWLYSDMYGVGAYRVYAPALALDACGVENEFAHHPDAWVLTAEGRARTMEGVDLIVFQRTGHPQFREWYDDAKQRGIKCVFELDDDIFAIPRQNPAYDTYMNKVIQRWFRWQLDHADDLWVSTQPLKERIAELSGRTARVCPNHLRPEIFGPDILRPVPRFPAKPGEVVIGWQGSITHDGDFTVAVPALQQVLDAHPRASMRFFGSVPLSVKDKIPTSRFTFRKGVEFKYYPTTLAATNFDIGIAPLTPSKFNRSKSHIKWLEYSAMGWPCVASAVYPYATAIRDGETGFLCETTAQWRDALGALLDDMVLRQRIGAAAFRAAWDTHGPAQGLRWVEAINALWPTEPRLGVPSPLPTPTDAENPGLVSVA